MFLRRADAWLLAEVDKLILYVARYFKSSGRHRPERIFGR